MALLGMYRRTVRVTMFALQGMLCLSSLMCTM